MSKVHDFCRDELPPPLISAKNLLTLDYVVKSIGPRVAKPEDNYGFALEYRFLKDYGAYPPEAFPVQNTSEFFATHLNKIGIKK
jgi:hypothetical protein